MVKVSKSNNTAKIQNIEIHERRSNNEQTWQTKIHRTAVELASTFVGQAIMMQFEKILWTLEKTATWISNGKTGKSKNIGESKKKQPFSKSLFFI